MPASQMQTILPHYHYCLLTAFFEKISEYLLPMKRLVINYSYEYIIEKSTNKKFCFLINKCNSDDDLKNKITKSFNQFYQK